MKKIFNCFKYIAPIAIGGLIGGIITLWIFWEIPVWLDHYCNSHDSSICQMQMTDDN